MSAITAAQAWRTKARRNSQTSLTSCAKQLSENTRPRLYFRPSHSIGASALLCHLQSTSLNRLAIANSPTMSVAGPLGSLPLPSFIAKRLFSTAPQLRSLNIENINPHIKEAKYAVRGSWRSRASSIEHNLAKAKARTCHSTLSSAQTLATRSSWIRSPSHFSDKSPAY